MNLACILKLGLFPVCGLVLFSSAVPLLAGQAPPPVTVRVTSDFSSAPLAHATVSAAGRTAMDALRECAGVETRLGGGFVTAINGVKAGGGREWFYYINGRLADAGAGSRKMNPGDHLWWDIHAWEGAAPITALIGCYPLPFTAETRSRGSSLISHAPAMRAKGAELMESLARAGARNIELAPLDVSSRRAGRLALILGPWKEIWKHPDIADFVRDPAACGMFVRFDKDGLQALGIDGKARLSFAHAGAIFAVCTMFSRDQPLWLVTGTDLDSTAAAADLLIREPQSISGMPGAVTAGGKIHPVPVMDLHP